MNEYIYRLEEPADYPAVEALTRDAFWNVYQPGCDEHYLLHIMRGNPAVAERLNFVCLSPDGSLCGHIFYTRTRVLSEGGEAFPVLSFGPISVRPDLQRQGIGSHLIRMTLDMASRLSFPGVVITGSPAYYGRFGFRPASEFGITAEDGSTFPELMALELAPGRMRGIQGRILFCPEFMTIDPDEALRFDRQFPPRERLKLPSQLQ